MITRVNPGLPVPGQNSARKVSREAGEISFGELLADAIKETTRLELEAQGAALAVASGGEMELHKAVIAAEKAELALQFTIQLRNRAIEAYQEIMRMQV